MRKVTGIFFLFSFLFASVIFAQSKTLVAVSDPWPPFVDPQTPSEGLTLEVVRAAFKTQGYTVKMEYVPWARAENGVKDGTYDILPNTWVTKKREAYLMYSEPYAYNELKFAKKKGDSFEYDGLKSLDGKKVGVVRGYGYGDDFMDATNFEKEEVTEMIANFRKLVKGRVDLTLEDEIVARVRIAQEDPDMLKEIEFVKNPLSKKGLYVTCGLANPRHKEIIEAFNKGLEIIKENGTYDTIMKKYGIE